MLGLATYQPHTWEVPKDDIYQAEHALQVAKEYIRTFIVQIETGTVRPLVGIAKQIRNKASEDLTLVEDAIKKLKSKYNKTYPKADFEDVSKLPAFGKISNKEAKLARVPNPDQQFYTCRICLRSKFTRPGQPHRCHGGPRKRFGKYARLKGWDSCFIETPKVTSSRSHCITRMCTGYEPLTTVHSSSLFHKASG